MIHGKQKNKMVDTNPIISVISLNVNGLNNPIKRRRLLNGIEEQEPTISFECTFKDVNWLKVKGWKRSCKQQPQDS